MEGDEMDLKQIQTGAVWNAPDSKINTGAVAEKKAGENENHAIMDDVQFSSGKKSSGINYKGLIAKTLVSTAVGAGVMVLSGGSALAALGYSTAIGAGLGMLKGVAHAFGKSLDFCGSSGSSSAAIDKNVGLMAGIMGVVGAAKGIARGVVLSALAYGGFGPLGGAVGGVVADTVMPSVGKGILNFLNRPKHQGLHD